MCTPQVFAVPEEFSLYFFISIMYFPRVKRDSLSLSTLSDLTFS
nr:MAG TPA: hypothetical protein [Caudoviricetes sp.]